jgi:hypothetical protein
MHTANSSGTHPVRGVKTERTVCNLPFLLACFGNYDGVMSNRSCFLG